MARSNSLVSWVRRKGKRGREEEGERKRERERGREEEAERKREREGGKKERDGNKE
jgi:hypothetical protein